jgi:HEAT repeat protein
VRVEGKRTMTSEHAVTLGRVKRVNSDAVEPLPGMTSAKIIELLEASSWEVQRRIARRASTGELIVALQQAASPGVCWILCYTLGHREEVEAAVPTLIECLQDADIRWAAADALAHIGDPRAGDALFQLYLAQSDPERKVIYVIGLGACKYLPAIPSLIAELEEPHLLLRSNAAWALGQMGARETEPYLRRAWERTEEGYDKEVIRKALNLIAD